MEILAGKDDLMADLKESGCSFKFDYSKVYWNSRLMGEHERIVNEFCKPNEFVCDAFCGIGPFAIPIAKNIGSVVFANDLNPSSYKYLLDNIKLNKMSHKILPYNMDGREFIQKSITFLNDEKSLQSLNALVPIKKMKGKPVAPLVPTEAFQDLPLNSRHFSHYILNLPATAIEFLDAFIGLYTNFPQLENLEMPLIHCHCFSSAEDKSADVIQVLIYSIEF